MSTEPGQVQTELDRERADFARADLDIAEGLERLQKQRNLVARLRRQGTESIEAERLAQLFADTLHAWKQHRDLIEQRIAYLEATIKCPE